MITMTTLTLDTCKSQPLPNTRPLTIKALLDGQWKSPFPLLITKKNFFFRQNSVLAEFFAGWWQLLSITNPEPNTSRPSGENAVTFYSLSGRINGTLSSIGWQHHSKMKYFSFLSKVKGLHRLLGGSTGPRYSQLRSQLKEKMTNWLKKPNGTNAEI